MNRLVLNPFPAFYRTGPQPCPYVDGRAERKIITELGGRSVVPLYNELSRAGFRRSQGMAYRPACGDCAACLPVRIVAPDYKPGRSARRLQKTNADLFVTALESRATMEQFRLFTRYQDARHGESDMAAMEFADYTAMVEDSPLKTVLVTARYATGELAAVCLIDELDDGCSAVYSFFDPSQPDRSLGTWMVQHLVRRMQQRGLPYVYLGYWIAGSEKMDYKTRFRPLEALRRDGWRLVKPG